VVSGTTFAAFSYLSSKNAYGVAMDAAKEFRLELPKDRDAPTKDEIVNQVKEALQRLKGSASLSASKLPRVEGYLLRMEQALTKAARNEKNAPPISLRSSSPRPEWASALTGLIGSYADVDDVMANMQGVSEQFERPINANDTLYACRGRETEVVIEQIERWLKKPQGPLEIPPFPGIKDLSSIGSHGWGNKNILEHATTEQLLVILAAVVKSCPNLESFALESCKVSPEIILLLVPLKKLQKLQCYGTVTAAHLPALARLPGLTDLTLRGCDAIDDSCLQTISAMQNLRRFDLTQSKGFTDDGLKHLTAMQLESLVVARCSRTALTHISQMITLQDVNLGSWDIENGDGFELLSSLINIRNLTIYSHELRDLSFAASLRGLKRFTCTSSNLRSETLRGLRDCLALEELDLCSTNIGDGGLAHLAGLINIRKLRLPNSITDAGLPFISHMIHMEVLALDNMNYNEIGRITSRGLASLANMTRMQALSLHHQNIDDEGLQFLARMQKLKRLSLQHCKRITGTGLEHLVEVVELEELNLSNCKKFAAESLVHLRGMIHMKRLELNFCEKMADSGLQCLSRMNDMETLHLMYCNLTDVGAEALSHMTKLKKLRIDGNKITLKGVQALKPMKALVELELDASIPVETAFLESLMELSSLRKFQYHGMYHNGDNSPVWAPLKRVLPKLWIH